ncbi:hypothetical protein DTO166G5_7054 [Paecilomyces variotii]|nr:hypothetical protein DTO166G5_7054 [Paecilomyces variotii]KAJ9244220.1 hypothetical protein DTO169E5_1825 [Paecilomyces variotii]
MIIIIIIIIITLLCSALLTEENKKEKIESQCGGSIDHLSIYLLLDTTHTHTHTLSLSFSGWLQTCTTRGRITVWDCSPSPLKKPPLLRWVRRRQKPSWFLHPHCPWHTYIFAESWQIRTVGNIRLGSQIAPVHPSKKLRKACLSTTIVGHSTPVTFVGMVASLVSPVWQMSGLLPQTNYLLLLSRRGCLCFRRFLWHGGLTPVFRGAVDK